MTVTVRGLGLCGRRERWLSGGEEGGRVGGGSRDRHTALLQGNALQTGLSAFSCWNMLVVKMADQPAPSRQSGPDVSGTRLLFSDRLEGLL